MEPPQRNLRRFRREISQNYIPQTRKKNALTSDSKANFRSFKETAQSGRYGAQFQGHKSWIPLYTWVGFHSVCDYTDNTQIWHKNADIFRGSISRPTTSVVVLSVPFFLFPFPFPGAFVANIDQVRHVVDSCTNLYVLYDGQRGTGEQPPVQLLFGEVFEICCFFLDLMLECWSMLVGKQASSCNRRWNLYWNIVPSCCKFFYVERLSQHGFGLLEWNNSFSGNKKHLSPSVLHVSLTQGLGYFSPGCFPPMVLLWAWGHILVSQQGSIAVCHPMSRNPNAKLNTGLKPWLWF